MDQTKKGCLIAGGSACLLPTVLVLFAVTRFVLHSFESQAGDGALLIAKITNVVLSLLGIVGVIALPLGTIYGFILLLEGNKKKPPQQPPQQPMQ